MPKVRVYTENGFEFDAHYAESAIPVPADTNVAYLMPVYYATVASLFRALCGGIAPPGTTFRSDYRLRFYRREGERFVHIDTDMQPGMLHAHSTTHAYICYDQWHTFAHVFFEYLLRVAQVPEEYISQVNFNGSDLHSLSDIQCWLHSTERSCVEHSVIFTGRAVEMPNVMTGAYPAIAVRFGRLLRSRGLFCGAVLETKHALHKLTALPFLVLLVEGYTVHASSLRAQFVLGRLVSVQNNLKRQLNEKLIDDANTAAQTLLDEEAAEKESLQQVLTSAQRKRRRAKARKLAKAAETTPLATSARQPTLEDSPPAAENAVQRLSLKSVLSFNEEELVINLDDDEDDVDFIEQYDSLMERQLQALDIIPETSSSLSPLAQEFVPHRNA